MKRIYLMLLFLHLLFITTNLAHGTKGKRNKIKRVDTKTTEALDKHNLDRVKRSLDNDEEDKPFWGNRGKKQTGDRNQLNNPENKFDFNAGSRNFKTLQNSPYELPFWGNRGRRFDSSSLEINNLDQTMWSPHMKLKYFPDVKERIHENTLELKDMLYLPWGNRVRRNSDESNDDSRDSEPFWGNRGRRQDDDTPFWGNRGRRQDDEPFWGNRGRRNDDSPFWGNRGRREDDLPFWGNRGRREDDTPFWGNRGRRDVIDKSYTENTINDVKNNMKEFSKFKQPLLSGDVKAQFWNNRGRNSILNYLFSGKPRAKLNYYFAEPFIKNSFSASKNLAPGTLFNKEIFAEQPHYIIVDRSSQSSSEAYDPFVSRGKKKTKSDFFAKAARDRRGIIEEIVKTVKVDPYYIARGKKDIYNNEITQSKNFTPNPEELIKAKEMICSAIDLMNYKKEGQKFKREMEDDRDRRTILKKLAAQLQMDPYYVSRGKKNISNDSNKELIEDFVMQVSEMCN